MIRIANAQGFWGDSLEAPLEQLRGGPIDYLTLDYLAEVTMSILQKQYARDPKTGYARDFPQMIERGAKEIVERGVKVVANAGGVNPEACADAVAAALTRAGYAGRLKLGIITGDNILPRLDEFKLRASWGQTGNRPTYGARSITIPPMSAVSRYCMHRATT